MQKLFTKTVEKVLTKYPYGSQDGLGAKAKVVARFFGGPATWYVLEDAGYGELYGVVDLGYGFEYGYFRRDDIEKIRFSPFGTRVERDIFVEPGKMTLGECAKQYGEEIWLS